MLTKSRAASNDSGCLAGQILLDFSSRPPEGIFLSVEIYRKCGCYSTVGRLKHSSNTSWLDRFILKIKRFTLMNLEFFQKPIALFCFLCALQVLHGFNSLGTAQDAIQPGS